MLRAAGDLAGARAAFEEATRLFTSIHDVRGMAETHRSLGLVAWAQGRSKDVRAEYHAAADLYAEAGDVLQQAQSLRSMTFDRDMTDDDAIAILSRAWGLIAPLKQSRTEGLILHQWGDRLALAGNFGECLEKLERAAPLLDQAGTPLEISYLATSLGRTYRQHGLPERALPFYEKALRISEQSGDQGAIAQALSALSFGYTALGRTAEALDLSVRGLEAARKSGNRAALYALIVRVSAAQIDVRRYADARTVLEEGLSAAGDPAMKQEEVSLRLKLSEALLGLGRGEDAGIEADHAMDLAERKDSPAVLFDAFKWRAYLRSRRHDPEGALEDSRRAIAHIERLRSSLPPRDFLKQGFGDVHRELFELAIEIRVATGDANGSLEMAEQARARAFQDLLAARDLSPSAGRSEGVPPSGASVEAPSLVEMKSVVGRIGSPLLEYWVAPRATYVWVVVPDGHVEARRIEVEATRMEALARAVSAGPVGTVSRGDVEAVVPEGRSPMTVHNRRLKELYDLLLKPVESVLRAQNATRLTIVPHGPLFRVSFAALRDDRGRYLIEKYELHYTPAVGVLRFTEKNLQKMPVRSALFVADPDLGSARIGEKFASLTGARLEVADAAKRFGPLAETLIGAAATEWRVRSDVGGRDVLHFATHAVLSDLDPLESYLALASTGASSDQDGRLTAAEIYSLDLQAELVILSACRSGAGKVTGDGMIGLSRGFFYAGAPSVLATLWDLADEPARFMIGAFYRHWRGGEGKAAALRASQIELIRALRAGRIAAPTPFGPAKLAEDPSLWASFVLLGEP